MADVAGYSKLMEADERAAVVTLDASPSDSVALLCRHAVPGCRGRRYGFCSQRTQVELASCAYHQLTEIAEAASSAYEIRVFWDSLSDRLSGNTPVPSHSLYPGCVAAKPILRVRPLKYTRFLGVFFRLKTRDFRPAWWFPFLTPLTTPSQFPNLVR